MKKDEITIWIAQERPSSCNLVLSKWNSIELITGNNPTHLVNSINEFDEFFSLHVEAVLRSVQRAKLVVTFRVHGTTTLSLNFPLRKRPEFKITVVYGNLFESLFDTYTAWLIAWRKLWKFRAQTVSLTKIEVQARSGTKL